MQRIAESASRMPIFLPAADFGGELRLETEPPFAEFHPSQHVAAEDFVSGFHVG